MRKISYDDRFLKDWITTDEYAEYSRSADSAGKALRDRSGPGSDFLGWYDLPARFPQDQLQSLRSIADGLRNKAETMITIGIGGSYLGARAALEFLGTSFDDLRRPRVVFAGHHLNSDYLADLKRLVENKDIVVNVISKSGTTTEPAVAFRLVRQWVEEKYGKQEARKRIVATTDPHTGALHDLAVKEGYAMFPVPPDIGGRFSVLTPVGLLPLAFANIDVARLVAGAAEAAEFCQGGTLENNPSARYAVNRNVLFRRGRTIEVLATFQPQLHFVGEWWKQLSGESEGKNFTGIFPSLLDYTTDLHSLGQWMQEGLRSAFETFMILRKTNATMRIPSSADDGDGLNFLAGRSIEEINDNAYKATLLAHLDGGVPPATLILEDRTEETLGQLFYFFEAAIALSGYLLRVNPFDQPGVEAYKKNMFALLSKPGFGEKSAAIRKRLEGAGL